MAMPGRRIPEPRAFGYVGSMNSLAELSVVSMHLNVRRPAIRPASRTLHPFAATSATEYIRRPKVGAGLTASALENLFRPVLAR